jgi:predicted negative regulator of RcsB-dependent stress response
MVELDLTLLECAVDRVTRKELKTDKFAEEVTSTVEYVTSHRTQVYRYGGIALALIVLAVIGWYYMRQQHELRQKDLAEALRTVNAAVAIEPNPTIKSFTTQAEKDKAIEKALNDLAAKYPSSDEGAIANYMLGMNLVDRGKLAEAEKYLKLAADSGHKEYASLAKLSMADLEVANGKTAEAEKILRDLMANPTAMVTKDQATISLARAIAKTKRDEALRLLEPLRTQSGAVSRTAIEAYATISQLK